MTGTRGPKSKDNAVRRNAPKAKTRMEGHAIVAPVLPDHLRAEAVTWYAAFVSAPWASMLAATDWQALVRGAHLVHAFYEKPSAQVASAIQRIEDSVGASVTSRDRLGWRIEEPSDEPDEKPAAPPRPDPRKK